MPPFGVYKKLYDNVVTGGNQRKIDSDKILEDTWYEDIGAKIAYLYDYYHDDEKLKYKNLNSENSTSKTKVEIKFMTNSYNSESKDQVGYHIQFKPSFDWKKIPSLHYYKEYFEDKYDAEFPIGLYIDIPDEKGIYRKWIITKPANWLDNQFPTYYVLPCDYIFRWISEDNMYEMCGVSRSQNSYNSGEWTNYKFTTTENQRKCILPMNDISSTLYYNIRLVISAPIKYPITWHCSKISQTEPNGLSHITFVQEEWNDNTDAFQYGDEFSSFYNPSRKVDAMWCNYYENKVTPEYHKEEYYERVRVELSYAGLKPEIKVKGSYKKIYIKFYDGETLLNNDDYPGSWNFYIDDVIVSDLVVYTTDSDYMKVKFVGDDIYIGKILKAVFSSNDGKFNSEIKLDIVGL